MRTVAADHTALATNLDRGAMVRVRVFDDANGWNADLTDLFGEDWIVGWEVSDRSEDPVASAKLTIRRDSWARSLSPYRTGEPYDSVGGYALLYPGRRFTIDVCPVPHGSQRDTASATWIPLFEGFAIEIEFGAEEVALTLSDLSNVLQRISITQDKPAQGTGSDWWTALSGSWPMAIETLLQTIIDGVIMDSTSTWVANTAYSLNEKRRPTTRNGRCYRVSTAGTSHATTEPTWPTAIGATVSDGTVVWTCFWYLPELYTPLSPGVNVNQPSVSQPIVRRGPLLDVLRTLVQQFGGLDLKYRYHEGTSAWRLTLYDPQSIGSTTTAFDDDAVLAVQQARISLADVRNTVRVVYQEDGKRKTYDAENTTSRQLFGPMFAEMTIGSSNALKTTAEATAMGDRILSDLGMPLIEAQLATRLYPWIELADRPLGLLYGTRWSDAGFDGCVIGVQHSGSRSEAVTSIAVREDNAGDAAFRRRTWIALDTRTTRQSVPAAADVPRLLLDAYMSLDQSVSAATATTLHLDTVDLDVTTSFDTANYRWEVPFDGVYRFDFFLVITAATADSNHELWLKQTVPTADYVGTTIYTATSGTGKAGSSITVQGTVTRLCTAGQRFELRYGHDDVSARNAVSGHGATGLVITRLR